MVFIYLVSSFFFQAAHEMEKKNSYSPSRVTTTSNGYKRQLDSHLKTISQ